MKKTIMLLLAAALFSVFAASCASGNTSGEIAQTAGATTDATTIVTNVIYKDNVPDNKPSTNTKGEPAVNIMMYSWDRRGLDFTVIKGSAAEEIEEIFERAQKTGKTEEKYSDFDGEITPYNYYLILPETEITPGTVWIEAGGKLYRKVYNSKDEKTTFCLVESDLGTGEVVSISEDDLRIYNNIKNYWPNDYYGGTYKDGTLTLEHLYGAESRVKLNVLRLEADWKSNKCKMTFEITSDTGGEFLVRGEGKVSYDVLLMGDEVQVNLQPGETRIAELTFALNERGDSWPTVKADNTKLYIHVDR